MAIQGIFVRLRPVLRTIAPRRSLAASAMWLIVALAVTFSIAAAGWGGSIARVNVLQQHIRRLALETDQLSSDLSQALSARLDAVRAAGPLLRAANAVGHDGLGAVFDGLLAVYPRFGWVAIVAANGIIVRSG